MSILFRHGRHAAPSGGPMFDLPELAHEPVTETITVVTAGGSPDDTQMFPAPVKDATFMLPVRRMARLRQAHVPPVLATGHTAIHITGRTLIGDSIPDEHGRFTLTCGHCQAAYADPAAGSFHALRDSARAAGWRQNLFGYWACTRDVRSNPLFIPQMPLAVRAA